MSQYENTAYSLSATFCTALLFESFENHVSTERCG